LLFQTSERAKVTGHYIRAIGRMRRSDGASCIENFSRTLWIVTRCVVQIHLPEI
jgi:hypothetical protein